MQHTKEELEIIENYRKAVDEDILHFVKKISEGEDLAPITVGFLSDDAAKKIEQLTGKSVCGNRVVLDRNGVIHIAKRHGKNGEQDESMKEINDIARIGFVLANYDKIEFYNEYAQGYVDSNGHLAPKVVISKKIDGIYYVIEAVSDSKRHRNYIVSAYIVFNNKKSDLTVPNNA